MMLGATSNGGRGHCTSLGRVKANKQIDRKKTSALKFGTWNVRTMTPDDLQTAVIDMELSRLQMDIVALQEMRLPDMGSVKEKNFSFFWQGKPSNETREYGVGFAVRNTLLRYIVPPTVGSESILSLKLHSSAGPVTLISAYAPTLSSTTEVKDKFYDDLAATVKKVPEREPLFILGSFNARVGSDHNSWPTCLGHFGIGKMNENGKRLLQFCCYYGLCVSNTFFNMKPQHRVSWRHPRSRHWHQLDLILTRRSSLPSITITRSYQSTADCGTDHSLVCSRVKLQTKRFYHMKKEGRPRIHISKTRDQRKVEEFDQALPGPADGTLGAALL